MALVETYAVLPFTLANGRGARVRDTHGREYWDLYGGHAVTLLGHSHAAVCAALRAQAERLTFYSNVAPLEIRERAAQRLAAFAPRGLGHVFFCNSGAEANENALKLALQQTGRRRLAAMAGGWHGRTLLALSVTTDEKITRPLDGLLCSALRLRPNVLEDLAQIDASIAAVIVEPILSIAGVIELTPEYRGALRRRCAEAGALLIFDEIQTGMGRLGRPLAAGEHDVLPDFVTLAKGIANGVPMGAVLMSDAVAAKVKQGDLGSTFGGGPLACAAMLAVLDTIEREDLCERAARLGRAMHERLRVGPVCEVLGRGCLIGLRLCRPAKDVQKALLERGFITGTSADPSVLRLMPPINTPDEAIEAVAGALAEC
ncbi:MAG: aminotransferase class III-fold pyridoxal phosphate-dependent enzyme [Phycisphaerae bacterium]|nr:aminotransferase class III-fold pyridoxal phosphate-dependent enzyme [Phycisphaerae bacterium]MCZ2398366.1 aminotransferase class III-fold pyridoxal phosphate-dependent enzyme [Phycisphaerae bacterium]